MLAEAREPLTWIFCVLASLTAALFLFHPAPFLIGGKHVSVYPPNNFVTLAYAALFLRLWKSLRPALLSGEWLQQIARWHLWPIAISFLFPRRLSAFVWFLGPFNKGERSALSWLETIRYYIGTIQADYHAVAWAGWVTLLLFALALISWRRLRRGGLAVLLFVVIAAALTLLHPNQKSRFLHSWFPLVWVAGAAGLANSLVSARRLGGPLMLTAGAALALTQARFVVRPGHAPEQGSRGETLSLLDLTDTYLSVLDGQRRVAVFATAPTNDLPLWTYRDRFPNAPKLEAPLQDFFLDAAEVQRRFQEWSAHTAAEIVVLIEIPPDSPDYVPMLHPEAFQQIAPMLEADPRFRIERRWQLPAHRCTITMWVRN